MAGLREAGLIAPPALPEQWVVDCRSVGAGGPAQIDLGRCLYRGVVQKKDIIKCDEFHVTFRDRDSAIDKMTLAPSPEPPSYGTSYSTSCPRASGAPEVTASCTPTANV